MAILAFQRPDKVVMVESTDKHGVFEFRPLEPGYGMTIGNALRRVLLSSLEGFAITSIRIEGVEHEMAPIPGVIEDLTDIVLKFKQVRFKQQIPGETFEKVTVVIGGQEEFVAGDINKFLSVFQVLNPELVICHMDPSVKLTIDMTINKGRGYVNADENKVLNAPVNTIAIDSIHTPIRNVSFKVDNYRVEQKTDYEKLILDIETDGSINPKDAMTEAAKILIYHLMLFSDERITLMDEQKTVSEDFDEGSLHIRQLLKTKLVDMDLSVRALNCLKAAEVETIGELVALNKADLLKFRNFGKKSLTELEELVRSKGLEFGMNISKYKLDKE
ncbi:MAG: DNA-directed RNA polymerase subunit alpha [Bacteroidales bacterium]|jgi:DNA-directed RNA polymerase subunit alpha|nr:DNA-directed RNA polymerase subunit alpha [Bacteroidota bacterium]MBO6057428.1 DNA-directed RNA polymerase subunit alpha [Bacteroidales bacterium]MBO7469483.1 DNA-directed RNA polymerase subunit alpha [Bacteroidales bacterium]MBQ3845129.1 DNA-directed RNA polymerase subunit alpha [Bacteroidales bacterium]MBR4838661.1 DNA-directed RNA polymerase subunit alpha [Bacteroidales bacterium]